MPRDAAPLIPPQPARPAIARRSAGRPRAQPPCPAARAWPAPGRSCRTARPRPARPAGVPLRAARGRRRNRQAAAVARRLSKSRSASAMPESSWCLNDPTTRATSAWSAPARLHSRPRGCAVSAATVLGATGPGGAATRRRAAPAAAGTPLRAAPRPDSRPAPGGARLRGRPPRADAAPRGREFARWSGRTRWSWT